MTATTVPQINLSARSAWLVVTASLVAVALSVTLPFLLRSTKTVLVRTTVPAATTSVPSVDSPALLRAAHGG
jgi:hypothetical protein